MVLVLIIMTLTAISHVTCVVIDTPPSNSTVFEGDDVIFECKTSRQKPGEIVIWKKISDSSSEILSINKRSTSAHYEIRGAYSLVVRGVGVPDEGVYVCEAQGSRALASLSVSVPMADMTLTSASEMPISGESDVTLICRTIHSHPPAHIRWVKGQIPLDDVKTTTTIVYQSDGFGDCESNITVRMREEEKNIPFRCIADLPARRDTREKFFFPLVTVNSASRSGMLWTLVVVTGIVLFAHLK